MDADLLDLARTVDLTALGARVKHARLARRMTQTEVAGTEMSTAYVSRIESGQRRPDPDLLVAIALRVGVGVDELVMGTTRDKLAEARLALDWAELSLRTGDAVGALEKVDDLLAESCSADLQVAALRVKAAALEVTGARDDAIILLEDLVQSQVNDGAWVDDYKALSRCYRDAGEFQRSVEVGEQGLIDLEAVGLGGTDEALGLALVVASSHAELGSHGRANRIVKRALAGAEDIGSVEARAKAYWTASIMLSRTGESAAALEMARTALTLLETSEDAHNVAKLRSQLGTLALRVDSPDAREALALLRAADLEMRRTQAPAVDRAFNRLQQARAHLMLGEILEARTAAREAQTGAADSAPLISAESHVLLGQVALTERDETGAKEHYRAASLELTQSGSDRGVAQLWFELGCLLEEVADTIGALDAYRSAGASTGLLPAASSARATALGIFSDSAEAQVFSHR